MPACFLELFSSTSAADSVSKIPAYKKPKSQWDFTAPRTCLCDNLVSGM